jgi:hypothetical protein
MGTVWIDPDSGTWGERVVVFDVPPPRPYHPAAQGWHLGVDPLSVIADDMGDGDRVDFAAELEQVMVDEGEVSEESFWEVWDRFWSDRAG